VLDHFTETLKGVGKGDEVPSPQAFEIHPTAVTLYQICVYMHNHANIVQQINLCHAITTVYTYNMVNSCVFPNCKDIVHAWE